MTHISEIRHDIGVIESDSELRNEIDFCDRADAIDFVEFHVLDRIEGLINQSDQKEDLEVLKHRAENVKRGLEEIDNNLFERLRENVRAGMYAGSAFTGLINKYTRYSLSDPVQINEAGYDNLDVFINSLLSFQAIPEAILAIEPEMVFYQKTPARIVFEMARSEGITRDDVFFDLGAGLGQVTILVNLISGAKSIGVEYEPAYCDYARERASELNLSGVNFINADARKADYTKGTVFFLYTPFEGSILEEVLNLLQLESEKRAIRIFTYGSCSSAIAGRPWLCCVKGRADDPHQLCEFRSLDIC